MKLRAVGTAVAAVATIALVVYALLRVFASPQLEAAGGREGVCYRFQPTPSITAYQLAYVVQHAAPGLGGNMGTIWFSPGQFDTIRDDVKPYFKRCQ